MTYSREVTEVIGGLAASSAVIQHTDDEIAGLEVFIESLRVKTAPLFDQIAALRSSEPTISGPDEAQVEALLASPDKAVDFAAITDIVHTARAEADATNMAVATVQAAIDRIESQIAETEEKVAILRARRADEFRDFAVAIQFELGRLFQSEFVRLRDLIMRPLLAVAKLRTSDGRADLLSVRNAGACKFTWDSKIAFEAWEPAFGEWKPTQLFDARTMTQREAESTVKAFRELLATMANT